MLCCLLQRHGLFGREVWDNQTADAASCSDLAETLNAKGHGGIVVTHEEQRNVALCRYLAGNLHTAVDGHAAFKGDVSGMLDGCAIGQGVAEGYTEFNDVGSSFSSSQHEVYTLCRRWVTTHEVGDEYSSSFMLCFLKGVSNFPGRYCGCGGSMIRFLVRCLHR